jgi:hypothetical protein
MRIEQLVLFALVYKMDSDDELWSWEVMEGKTFSHSLNLWRKINSDAGKSFNEFKVFLKAKLLSRLK